MRILITLLLLALIAVKVAAVLAGGPVPIELDAFQYWRLSALVLDGDLLLLQDPIAYRTPVYPWFIAFIRSISGSWSLLTICVVQGMLSIATMWIAGHLAARISKLPWAMVWTLLISLPSVSALTFNAAVLSETVFIFLFMLNLLAVLDYAKYGTLGRSMWVGFTFALALLTRPIVLYLWIPHVLFLLYIHVRKKRRLDRHAPRLKLHHRLLHGVVAAITIGALIAPWLMRNQYLFGEPFITQFVGRNVWIVTFQDGSGAGLDLPASDAGQEVSRRLANVGQTDEKWRHTWTTSKALVTSGLNDPQTDRLMKQVCLDALATDPPTFAYKAFRRVVNFWRCAATDLPQQGRAAGQFRGESTWERIVPPIDWAIDHRWSQSVALNTLLAAILVAANLFLILNYSTRPYGVWMGMILAYFAVVTGVLEIPAYRYRIVVEPLAATVIGAAIAVLRSRKRRPATVTV